MSAFLERFPSLGLLHPVGKKLMTAVTRARTEKLQPKVWYRRSGNKHISSAEDFLGYDPMRPYRFNQSGQRALYLAAEEETAVVETLQEHKAKPLRIWVAEMTLKKKLEVLDVAAGANQSLFLRSLVLSTVLQTPRKKPGHFQPQYLLTRFLADIARRKAIDGILYRSGQEYPFTYEMRETNLVILRPDYCDFVTVRKYESRAWRHTGDWRALEPQRMVLEPSA